MARVIITLKNSKVIECNTNNNPVNKDKIYEDLKEKYNIHKSQIARIVQKIAKPVE